MEVADRIRRKLTEALTPSRLDVYDDSHRHVGHVGARPEGETHFTVEIVSDAFAGLTRLERHRLVHEVLADELAGPVHALSLKMLTTSEANAAG